MGIFDDNFGEIPDAPVAAPTRRVIIATPPTPAPSNIFDDNFGTAPPAPREPGTLDWSKYNQPFGELKSYDPSWTQSAKDVAQSGLMAIGMPAYNAGRIGGGVVDVGKTVNPLMGSVLSAADASYNLLRGKYGDAAFDVVGAAPGALAAKRFISGVPKVPMADVPRMKSDLSFLPERGAPDPYGTGPYGLKGPQVADLPRDELQQAGSQAYRDTRYAPVDYHPRAMNDFTARAKQGLEHPELGFSPEKAPLVHSTLDRWVNAMGHRNTPISAADWDTLRQQLKGLEGADGVAGNHVAGWIDQYMINPPPGALIRGTQADLDNLKNIFDVARGNWRSYKTSETVAKEIDRAGTRAGSKNSGLNVGNMTRAKLEGLTTTDAGENKIFGARPDEIAAINSVVAGSPLVNWQRDMSNRLAGGGGTGNTALGIGVGSAATTGAHFLGADPYTAMGIGTAAGLGVGKLGTALRVASNEGTVRAAEDVVNLIRKNSPEYAARLRATPDITDPRAMMRDAITYALLPKVAQQGQGVWDRAHVPYEDRGESYDPSLE
jgi:hypothetical protein